MAERESRRMAGGGGKEATGATCPATVRDYETRRLQISMFSLRNSYSIQLMWSEQGIEYFKEIEKRCKT